jgi:hypothetical protein
MAEFLHEVVRNRELSSAGLPPGLSEWHRAYVENYNRREAEYRREFIESILGRLEEGSDDADL